MCCWLFQLRRELTAQAAGLQFIPASELKKSLPASSDVSEEPTELDVKDARRPVAYRKVALHSVK